MSGLTGGKVSGSTLTVDGNAAVVTYSYDLGYTGTELDDAEKDVIFTLAIAGRGTDIAINETNFPDKDFREFLLDKEANIDRNQDGKLSTGEIALVQDIDVYDMEIADLTGIEYFTELKYLDCAGNHLTSLDLSRNTKLAELDAENNTYTITPVNDRFYLASLPAGFDVAKTSHWQGGTVSGNILTINSDVDEVTYDYDCEKDFTTTFTLEIPTQYTVTAHGLYGGGLYRTIHGRRSGRSSDRQTRRLHPAGSDARGNQRRAAAMAGKGRGKHNSRYFLRDARA